METQNKFLEHWKQLEASEPRPTRMRNILEIEFDELRRKVLKQEPVFVRGLVNSLWSGDVYLVKRAFDRAWVENVKKSTAEYFQKTPPSFYKMKEGCPDFHRIIDAEMTKLYAVGAVKHACYFFPWNEDPLDLFEPIGERWKIYKFLSGFSLDEYIHNTPKDGVVDRIQICVYPSGAGGLETHSDPYLNQRVFISGYLSQRGEDFNDGGFYAINQKDEKVDLESRIEVGDMGFGYATILHGVNPIDPAMESDWKNTGKGRWFLGLYSNDSDEKEKRHTGYMVNLSQAAYRV